jgi:hypothetical protein
MSVTKKFKALAEGADPNKAWCFIAVPFDVPKLWGTRGRIPVKGTINGFPYRTNIQRMGSPPPADVQQAVTGRSQS